MPRTHTEAAASEASLSVEHERDASIHSPSKRVRPQHGDIAKQPTVSS